MKTRFDHRGFTLMVSVLVLGGCASTKREPLESKVVPKVDFQPPTTSPVDTNSVAFCLINPEFPNEWKEVIPYYPFDKFSKNMAADFEEILSARGFRMRGPFKTFDEITFPDKNQSDLTLMPKIDIEVKFVGQPEMGKDILGTLWYRWRGQVNLTGRISVYINEP